MAITFLEQRKRQQYMIPLLVLVLVVTSLVVWYGVIKPQQPVSTGPIDYTSPEEGLPSILKKVDIDFNFLNNFTTDDFQIPEPISTFDKEVGRENPFIPF